MIVPVFCNFSMINIVTVEKFAVDWRARQCGQGDPHAYKIPRSPPFSSTNLPEFQDIPEVFSTLNDLSCRKVLKTPHVSAQ